MALHPTAEVMIQLLTEAGMTFTLDATPESRRAAMIADRWARMLAVRYSQVAWWPEVGP